MNNTVLIDTNLYLDDSNIISKLSKEFERILIPIAVLKELDKHKYNRDLSYSARSAIQAILDFTTKEKDKVIFDTERYTDIEDPDHKILAAAKKYGAKLATKDISMSIIAKSLNLDTMLHDVILNNIFDPYVHLHMSDLYSDDYLEHYDSVFSYKSEYMKEEEYEAILLLFSKVAGRELSEDHWWFSIIDVDTNAPVIYANNPLKRKIERIDDKPIFRRIYTDGSVIKARDCYQVCAIYALENAPHTLITGRWGSGKTLLATAHALAGSKKKAFITRAPLGLNSKYDIGFLPGPLEDKMIDWLQGFMSALYFLYSNTRSDSNGNGTTYDYVKDRVFHEKFQIIPMNSIQGLSLLDNDTLIVDECQLITTDYMSMILSRPSETGRLILLGDIKQSYGVVKPSESGLLKLLRVLPHKYMAYVKLQNSYRSPLLEVADKLQDKSIIG
jgi:PhoH-like ATPase